MSARRTTLLAALLAASALAATMAGTALASAPAAGPECPDTPGVCVPDGQPGAPGQDGEVIRETVIREAPIVIREAPAPRTVQSDLAVTH